MFNDLKVSIWGAGSIAQTHAIALKKLGIQVEVVYDINLDNAKKVASICDAKIATSNEKDIFDNHADCVHLCTPANLHYEQLSKLFDANLNVFCEKPLTLCSKEAKVLLKKVKEKNIKTAVGFNNRFYESIFELKNRISSKDFGKIKLIHGTYLQEFNAFPAPLDWRYNTEMAGKMRAVTEIGSHWMDLLMYVTGKEIKRVSANFLYFNPIRKIKNGIMNSIDSEGEVIEVHSEDAAIISFEFTDGVLGACVLSESSPGRINHISFEITGENGNVYWNGEKSNSYRFAKKNLGMTEKVFPFTGGFSDTHYSMFYQFYSGMKTSESEICNYATFEDGVYNVILTDSIYESAHNDGKWVNVKFD